jgi:ABC-type cobalt transport system substrate-binding protein
MTRTYLYLPLVVCILALAVMLKVDRYAHGSSSAKATAQAHVEEVMNTYGWHAQGAAQEASGVYAQLQFHHDACKTPVIVAFLLGNAETSEFFRNEHGGDVMFVDGGEVVDRPSLTGRLRRKLQSMSRQMRSAFFAAEVQPVLPVLGIAPAADRLVSGCRGPSRMVWQGGQTSTVR